MKNQEVFPFAERADESQKNAIVIMRNPDPKIPDPDFDSIMWVLRARSKDADMLLHLCSLHSDGQGRFVATDGHRLHAAEIPALSEKIPGGIWLFVHADKKKVSVLEAPADIRAYPNLTGLLDLDERHQRRGWLAYEDDTQAIWSYWDLTGIKSNITYVIDVCKDIEPLEVFSSDPAPGKVTGSKSLPVIFCSQDAEGRSKKAILMPLNG